MGQVALSVNGKAVSVDVEPEMPLLWALRAELGLNGTKFGCGIAQCGACTVHVDGRPIRSCVTPISAVAGKAVRTIEDLGTPAAPHPIQKAWLSEQVPQCGYCQSGMQMAAAALVAENPAPTDEQIAQAVRNICRCGCYDRIRSAIRIAAAEIHAADIPTGEDMNSEEAG
ncbi:MAG: (2Fe-2S)-binding protein [Myxococcota bacterium]